MKRDEVCQVRVLENEMFALHGREGKREREEREDNVVRGERAQDAAQVKPSQTLGTGAFDGAEKDGADEKTAEDEEEVHAEKDRRGKLDKRAIERDFVFTPKDPRDVPLNDADDAQDAKAVERWVSIVEKLEREESR